MRSIDIGQLAALVDDDLYERLSVHKWRPMWLSGIPYAAARIDGKTVLMHRYIMGLAPCDPKKVDHRNRNSLDNQRCNLRFATPSQNMCNRQKMPQSKQPYKGIELMKGGRWRSRIRVNGKRVVIPGSWATPEEAHEKYKAAAMQLHGEFACLI